MSSRRPRRVSADGACITTSSTPLLNDAFAESVFGDPENSRIDRNPNSHMAFGFGTHFCLGNQLAGWS